MQEITRGIQARTQQEYRTIPRSQQVRQRKEQAFEGTEEYDYAVDPRAGGSINKRRETCRLRRHRPRQQSGNTTIGRQEVGIPGFLHSLTLREFFSQSWDPFRLAEGQTS